MAQGDPYVTAKQVADQLPPVKKLVFIAEKTYQSIEPEVIPPLETTLARMTHNPIWSLPCPRFKRGQGKLQIGWCVIRAKVVSKGGMTSGSILWYVFSVIKTSVFTGGNWSAVCLAVT